MIDDVNNPPVESLFDLEEIVIVETGNRRIDDMVTAICYGIYNTKDGIYKGYAYKTSINSNIKGIWWLEPQLKKKYPTVEWKDCCFNPHELNDEDKKI